VNTNVNLSAAVGVLGLLGACAVLALLGLVALHALARGRYRRMRVSLVGLALCAAAYGALVLAFSVESEGRVLARGEEKYFCEIDCHLAYSVVDVRRAKALGTGGARARARGEFLVVTLRTRFDPNTISAGRGDGQLTPNPREVSVCDAEGRTYAVSEEGRRALSTEGGVGMPLDTPLRPGESYTTGLVFDLPEGARDTVLLVRESSPETRFIIGHENSPLHGKTEFAL
jgi:hypothetical protein